MRSLLFLASNMVKRFQFFRRRIAVSWLVGLCMVTASGGRADIIPDGRHGVNHEIFFTGMADFPEWDFGLFPVTIAERWVVIKEGEEPNWYKFADPKLYAWPKSRKGPENDAFFNNADLPRTAEIFKRIGTVREDDPLWRVRTTYRIMGVEGMRIMFRKESEWKFDRDGRLLGPAFEAVPAPPPVTPPRWREAAGFGLLAAVSLAGLILIIRRRKANSLTDNSPA